MSSNELLKQIHWLSVEWRIRFKLATLTSKALHTGRPPYLSDLLQYHEPTRSLRSSNSHQLSVPHHNLSFGSRAFRLSTPRVWNSLACQHPRISVTSYFQTSSKDILLSVSLPHFSCPSCLECLCSRALILLRLWPALYKSWLIRL